MLKFLQTDRQTDKQTDRWTGQKLYAPDLSIRGHKKEEAPACPVTWKKKTQGERKQTF
jgi:hypothetical protein